MTNKAAVPTNTELSHLACQCVLVHVGPAYFLKECTKKNHESAVNKSLQYLAFQVTNIGDRFKGRVSGVLHATYTPINQGVEMINCKTVLIVCTSF